MDHSSFWEIMKKLAELYPRSILAVLAISLIGSTALPQTIKATVPLIEVLIKLIEALQK